MEDFKTGGIRVRSADAYNFSLGNRYARTDCVYAQLMQIYIFNSILRGKDWTHPHYVSVSAQSLNSY